MSKEHLVSQLAPDMGRRAAHREMRIRHVEGGYVVTYKVVAEKQANEWDDRLREVERVFTSHEEVALFVRTYFA